MVLNQLTLTCQYCPSNYPVITNFSCSACPNGTFYSPQSGICVQCPDNSVFDSVNNKCIVSSNGSTIIPSCPVNAVFDTISQQCVCPTNLPYTDGYRCLNCYPPTYWNQSSRECLTCPDGTVFNLISNGCVPCPINAPLEINGVCTVCPSSSFYSIQYSICVQCAAGSTYDQNSGNCVANQQPTCPIGATYNPITNLCQCPIDKPYANSY
jgi:hypothetical protein